MLTMCLYVLHKYAPSHYTSSGIDFSFLQPTIKVEQDQLIVADVSMCLTLQVGYKHTEMEEQKIKREGKMEGGREEERGREEEGKWEIKGRFSESR